MKINCKVLRKLSLNCLKIHRCRSEKTELSENICEVLRKSLKM